MSEEYKKGYREGFIDGFAAANASKLSTIPTVSNRISIPTVFPNYPLSNTETTCVKCGMVWKGAMAYSCPHMNCPVQPKVTC